MNIVLPNDGLSLTPQQRAKRIADIARDAHGVNKVLLSIKAMAAGLTKTPKDFRDSRLSQLRAQWNDWSQRRAALEAMYNQHLRMMPPNFAIPIFPPLTHANVQSNRKIRRHPRNK